MSVTLETGTVPVVDLPTRDQARDEVKRGNCDAILLKFVDKKVPGKLELKVGAQVDHEPR